MSAFDPKRTFAVSDHCRATIARRVFDLTQKLLFVGGLMLSVAGAALSKALKKGKLKINEKFPHGMCTTHADAVNPELLAFTAGGTS